MSQPSVFTFMRNYKPTILLSLIVSIAVCPFTKAPAFSMPVSANPVSAHSLVHTAPVKPITSASHSSNSSNTAARSNSHGIFNFSNSSSAGLNLNLGSNRLNVASPFSGTIQTSAGSLNVKAGQLITAAEFAAVSQIISSGAQSIQLDASGRSTGGTFSLASISAMKLHELVIPARLTVLGAQSGSELSLSGGLFNGGMFLALPLSSATVFNLNVGALRNSVGASISTVVPSSLNAAYSYLHAPVSLNIKSTGNIVNRGDISSAANLSLTSSAAIFNGAEANQLSLSAAADSSSARAHISANGDIAITSGSGILVNSGSISSQLAGITISSSNASDLVINNTNGMLAANNGVVRFSNLSNRGAAAIDLSGGLISGSAVDFSVRNGAVNVSVNEIDGPVDVHACAAHVATNGGNLALRNMDLSGDPSFVNSNGDITLLPNAAGGVLNFPGQDLAILASGDVIADPTLSKIDLSAAAGGGSLFISAGFQVSPSTGVSTVSEPPLVPGGYTVGAPSLSGGSIRLAGVSIDTSASANQAQGGSVTLIAHDNDSISQNTFAANDKGFIQVGTINTSSPHGSGGNVVIVAQSDSLAINSLITTNGTLPQGGSVEISTGVAVFNSLTFVNGTRQPGDSISLNTDASHDAVPLDLIGAFSPTTLYGAISLDSSGLLSIGANSIIPSAGLIHLTSHASDVKIGNNSQIGAFGGEEVIVAAKNVDLGTGTTFDSQIVFGDVTIKAINGSITGGGGNTIGSVGGSLLIESLGGDFRLGNAGANTMLSHGDLVISTSGNIDLSNTNNIHSGGSIVMASQGTLTVGPGSWQAGLPVVIGVPTSLLASGDILAFGGIFLYSNGNLKISATTMQTYGSDLVATSSNGTLQLASGTSYAAAGGNVALLAGKQVSGDNNKFSAIAIGAPGNFAGGIVELSAGFTFNPFQLSLLNLNTLNNAKPLLKLESSLLGVANHIEQFTGTPSKTFTSPALDKNGFVLNTSILGTNVKILNNGVNVGLVLPTKLGGGTVDVGGSILSLNKGAVFFDAVTAGASVSVTNAQISTLSYSVLPSDFSLSLSGQVSLVLSITASAPAGSHQGAAFIDRPNGGGVVPLPPVLHDFSNTYTQTQIVKLALTRPVDTNMSFVEVSDINTIDGSLSHASFEDDSFYGVDTGKTGTVSVGSSEIVEGGESSNNALALGILNENGVASSPVRVSEQRNDLVLFTTAGQVLTGDVGGSSSANVIGSAGTTVSNDSDKLLLHGGKIYANSGKQPMKITTVYGAVSLAPDTSAAIIANADRGGRLVVLGNSNANATLNIGGKVVSLKAGEQALISELSESRSASTGATRSIVVKERADVNQLLANDGFFSSRSIRLSGSGSAAYQRMLERIKSGNGGKTGQQQGAISQDTLTHQSHIEGVPSRVLASAGTVFQQDSSGAITVKTGSLLIKPESVQTLKTPIGNLIVQAGAVAEVQVFNGRARFRAYSGPDQVVLSLAGRKIALGAGQEIMLQRQKPTKEEALPFDGIARRGLTNIEFGRGLCGVSGDFSIVSSLQSRPYMRALRNPSNAESISLRSDLLKTAACLNIVRGAQGRYFMPEHNSKSESSANDKQNELALSRNER